MRKRTWRSSLRGRCVGLSKNEDVGGGRSPQEGDRPLTVLGGIRKPRRRLPEVGNILVCWRRGRDLNSRTPCEVSSFQDWHVRPLRHPSKENMFDPEL